MDDVIIFELLYLGLIFVVVHELDLDAMTFLFFLSVELVVDATF